MFQFSWRPPLVWRRRLWHHLAVAGGAHPTGRHGRRLCHGVRPADCGHHLEPWHLVAWTSRLLFAHFDRLDHRRRCCQCPDARPGWNLGRRLEQGHRNRLLAPAFAGFWFLHGCGLLLLLKFLVRKPELYAEPRGNAPPPWWI